MSALRTKSGDMVLVERKKTPAPQRGPNDVDMIQTTAYYFLVTCCADHG